MIRAVPLILFFALCNAPGASFAQKNGERIQRTVDSLNEAAFRIKRYDFAKALRILESAQQLALKNNYHSGLSIAYIYEAGIYQQFGYLKNSLVLYQKALQISQLVKDSFNVARANQQIASAFVENGKIDEAEKMYIDARIIFTRLDKKEEVVNINNAIGLIYLQKKKFDSAMANFNAALAASRQLGYTYGEKKSCYNLALLYKEKNDKERAVRFLNRAIEMDESTNDKYGLALSRLQLSRLYNADAQTDLAVSSALESYKSAKQVSALQIMIDALKEIIQAYRNKRDYNKVSEWQAVLIDTLVSKDKNEKGYALDFLEIIRQHENRQLLVSKQALEAEQSAKLQRILLIIATLAFVALSVLAYLLYKNYNKSRMFAAELEHKNEIIEKNAAALDKLNKAISAQNQSLEEENRMKDKLLSIISHDLRHPMVNTKSILELINLKLVTEKETEELLEQLEGQYVRSIALLDNLLFWIRGQMKGKDLELAPVNVHELIDGMINEQRMSVQSKSIRMENETSHDMSITGDKEMLKIIFRNLLSNAIKFTPSNGTIRLSSYRDDHYNYIVVKDSGIGMSRATLQKVNARQYFSSKGTSNEKGSGFGLILCHDLIRMHKGELLIESEPGRGSTFVVKIPHLRPESAVASHE